MGVISLSRRNGRVTKFALIPLFHTRTKQDSRVTDMHWADSNAFLNRPLAMTSGMTFLATALPDTRWSALCCDGWDVTRMWVHCAALTERRCRLDLIWPLWPTFYGGVMMAPLFACVVGGVAGDGCPPHLPHVR